MNSLRFRPVSNNILNYFLQKLAAQSYIRYLRVLSMMIYAFFNSFLLFCSIKDISNEAEACYEVILVESVRVQSLYNDIIEETDGTDTKNDEILKRKCKFFILKNFYEKF